MPVAQILENVIFKGLDRDSVKRILADNPIPAGLGKKPGKGK